MFKMLPPKGFKFTGEFRAPKRGDYWVSVSSMIAERNLGYGPLKRDNWPEDDPRVILEKKEEKR